MTAPTGADEIRAAHYLRARGLGYTPGATMTEPPITPTRIIPAGAPLPGRAPAPGELPPWWEPPPAPPAPPQAAPPTPTPEPQPDRPIQVYVTVQPGPFYEPEPLPEPTLWERAGAALRRIGRPWQLALALGLAAAPIPHDHGYSAATTWHYVIAQTRHDHGAPWAYALGFGVLTAAAALLVRKPGLVRLWVLAVALIGALGAIAWFDPITALTGVHR